MNIPTIELEPRLDNIDTQLINITKRIILNYLKDIGKHFNGVLTLYEFTTNKNQNGDYVITTKVGNKTTIILAQKFKITITLEHILKQMHLQLEDQINSGLMTMTYR